jgi:hypothetical protein
MRQITDGRSKAGSIAFLELRQDRTATGKFPVMPFYCRCRQRLAYSPFRVRRN